MRQKRADAAQEELAAALAEATRAEQEQTTAASAAATALRAKEKAQRVADFATQAPTSSSPTSRRLAESGDTADSQESVGSPEATESQLALETCTEAILAGTSGPECAQTAQEGLAKAARALVEALARQAAADQDKEQKAAAVTEAYRRVTKAWTDPTVPEAETAEALIDELVLAWRKLHHRSANAPENISLKRQAGQSQARVELVYRALQESKDAEREANPKAAAE